MQKKEIILSELKETCPLLSSVNNYPLFTVPQNYFDCLADEIINRIKIEQLLKEAKGNTFTIPGNSNTYFTTLPDLILSKIKNQSADSVEQIFNELEEVAPLLNTISKKPVYHVPGNYFEGLAANSAKNKPFLKVVSFSLARKWISYAAAAIMAGVLVTGAFRNENNINSSRPFNVNIEINNLKDEDLESYLNNANVISYPEDTSGFSGIELPDLQEGLQMISDDELQKYLKENEDPVATVSDKTNSGS